MQKRILAITVATIVAIGLAAGAFLMGTRVGGAKLGLQMGRGPGNGQAWQGGPGGQRFRGSSDGFGPGMMGGGGADGFRQGPDGMAFVGGKVVSKDKDSITVSTQDGGSKTIYLSSSTRIEKLSRGTIADISVGETVTAVGNAGSDGTITGRNLTVQEK